MGSGLVFVGLISEIDSSVVVIDCEYNMDFGITAVAVYNRTLAFIRALKAGRPATPVLLLEGHDHARAWISPPTALKQNQTREAYRRAYNQLLDEGVTGLYYGEGALKLGGPMASFYEAQVGTCAGVHPVSLGLKHMARYVVGLVRAVLTGEAQPTREPTGGVWPPPDASTSASASTDTSPPPTTSADTPTPRGPPPQPHHAAVAVAGAGTSVGADVGADVGTEAGSAKARPRLPSAEESTPAAVEEYWAREVGGVVSIEDHPGASSFAFTDACDLGIDGKGFPRSGSKNCWQRFPDSAQAAVPKGIWVLSTAPSGIIVRFTTDAAQIAIRITRSSTMGPRKSGATKGERGFSYLMSLARLHALRARMGVHRTCR